MKRTVLFCSVLAIVLAGGCGTKFNAPFINTDETLQLVPNMTMEEVTALCGVPLYVAFGDGNITVWVYEVRVLEVGGSESIADVAASGARARLRMGESSGLMKQGAENDHGEVLPYLMLYFEDDGLRFWSTYEVLYKLGFGQYMNLSLPDAD